jgi:lactate dehydrogenase-like 2-hydroxyacid dehydrogenase
VPVQAAWAQSLADVARKEEERRKAIKEEVKVYTNEDLGLAGVPPPPQPADPSALPEGAAAQAPAAEPAPMEDEQLRGRVALVTGGGRGIGRAVAMELADAGMRVAVTARTADEVAATAAEVAGQTRDHSG